jgi:hypothetical protein
MRCLGCDRTVKAKKRRSFTWELWQICPNCFKSLVPSYYQKKINVRLEMYGR